MMELSKLCKIDIEYSQVLQSLLQLPLGGTLGDKARMNIIGVPPFLGLGSVQNCQQSEHDYKDMADVRQGCSF